MKRFLEYLALASTTFLLVILWFFVFSPNYKIYVLEGKSMEPYIKSGDLLIFKEGDVKPGTVILFERGNELITHRVNATLEKNQIIIPQGDANNNNPDPPIHIKNVLGIYVFHIPFLGYLSILHFFKIPLYLILFFALIIRVGGQLIWRCHKN